MTGSRKRKDKRDKKSREKKSKKKKKQKSDREEDDDSKHAYDSSDRKINLSEELHPIGYFINDRNEMIEQMFSVMNESKLKAMLPPILRKMPIGELKGLCLNELLGMSSKRIHAILEGRELLSSSDSDDAASDPANEIASGSSPVDTKCPWTSDDDKMSYDSGVEKKVGGEKSRTSRTFDMDTLEIGITKKEMGELLKCMPSDSIKEKRSSVEMEKNSTSQKKVRGPNKNIKHKEKTPVETSIIDVENEKTETGKTLLEILELEMRARAIRALLKQQDVQGDSEDAGSSTVVDYEDRAEGYSETKISSNICDKSCDVNNAKPIFGKRKHKGKECVTSQMNDDDISITGKKLMRHSSPKPQVEKSKPINTKKTKEGKKIDESKVKLEKYDDSEKKAKVNSVLKSKIQKDLSLNKSPHGTAGKTGKKGTSDGFDREDGELSSEDDGKTSSESVLVLPENDSDVIVLNDSDDNDILEIEASNKYDILSGYEKLLSEDIPEQETAKLEKRQVEENYPSKSTSSPKVPEKRINLSFNFDDELNEPSSSESTCKKNDNSDCSWASRWLQSKDVQRVVSTSKMCAKMRKRMRTAHRINKSDASKDTSDTASSVVIEGSVDEYKMLDKPK